MNNNTHYNQEQPRHDDEFPDRETAWSTMQNSQTPSDDQAKSMGATEDDPRFPEVQSVTDRDSSTDADLTNQEAQTTRYPGEQDLPPTQNEDEGAAVNTESAPQKDVLDLLHSDTNATTEDVASSGVEYSETHPESDDPRYPSDDRDQAYRGEEHQKDVLDLLDRTNDTLIDEDGRPVVDDGDVIDSFEPTASRAARELGELPRAPQNPPY